MVLLEGFWVACWVEKKELDRCFEMMRDQGSSGRRNRRNSRIMKHAMIEHAVPTAFCLVCFHSGETYQEIDLIGSHNHPGARTSLPRSSARPSGMGETLFSYNKGELKECRDGGEQSNWCLLKRSERAFSSKKTGKLRGDSVSEALRRLGKLLMDRGKRWG